MWFLLPMIFLICGLAWFLSVRGGLITGVVGILMMPWKLLRDFSSYICVVLGARIELATPAN